MFKTNVGAIDRVIRAVLGVVLVAVFFLYPEAGWKWAAMLIGLVLLFTAVMSSCAIYRILGISTNKTGDEA